MYRRMTAFSFILLCGASLLACEEKKSSQPLDLGSESLPASPKESAAQAAAVKAAGEPSRAAEAKRLMLKVLPKGEELQQVVNPAKLPNYAGPTGTVVGVVSVTGDAPPLQPKLLKDMAANCDRSREIFGRQFREGKNRTLADVFIGVTGYNAFVPPKSDHIKVEAKGCAWNQRTFGVTFGQYLSISGADRKAYVPELLGQSMPAQLFVLPTAPDVILPPKKPGRYVLLDSMRLYNTAEVFVVPYATFDVTDLEGQFKIADVPVGIVKVSAYSPALGKTVEEEVEVKEGQQATVNFSLQFKLPSGSK